MANVCFIYFFKFTICMKMFILSCCPTLSVEALTRMFEKMKNSCNFLRDCCVSDWNLADETCDCRVKVLFVPHLFRTPSISSSALQEVRPTGPDYNLSEKRDAIIIISLLTFVFSLSNQSEITDMYGGRCLESRLWMRSLSMK